MTGAGAFADKMNNMPKFVVSTELEKPERNNSTLLSGDVVQQVTGLKQQTGGDLLINGSATLVQTLMEHDLIDEYRLMVFPIVLGGGKRLFGDASTTTAPRLVHTAPIGPDGVVALTYQPARDDKQALDAG
jgi:dihydrofolate reductase